MDVSEILAAFADAHAAATQDECLSRQAALELAREHFAEHLKLAQQVKLAQLGMFVLEKLREYDVPEERQVVAHWEACVDEIDAAACSLGLLGEEARP